MFERFTDGARRVVTLAQEEARRLQNQQIRTGHMMLGFFLLEGEDSDEIPVEILEDFGYSPTIVKERAGILAGFVPSPGHVPFTSESKKALELSLREALQLGHNYIGTEHLLLGLLRVARDQPESECALVFGMYTEEIRRATVVKIIQKLEDKRQAKPIVIEVPDPPPPAEMLSDIEAIRAGVAIIERLPRERRKAVMRYLREYAKQNEG